MFQKIKRLLGGYGGPSFAFWNKDKNTIKEILQKSVTLSKELSLSRNPDDYWLSLFMGKKGNLEATNKTWVTQNTKETSTKEAITRNKENHKNGNVIADYLNNKLE